MPNNTVTDMSAKSGFLELSSEHQSQGAAVSSSDLAIAIGNQILNEFDRFYRDFTEITQSVKAAFEQ